MIQPSGGANAFELAGRIIDSGPLEQPAQLGRVAVGHRFFLGIGAESVNLAAHIDHGLVERIAQAARGVAANDQPAGLGHERRDMSDTAADDNVAAFHRDAATARCIPFDDDQPTMPRRPDTFGSIAAHADHARHDILGHAPADAAMHVDASPLVHAADEIAGMAADCDVDVGVQPDGQVVHAVGVEDLDLPDARARGSSWCRNWLSWRTDHLRQVEPTCAIGSHFP